MAQTGYTPILIYSSTTASQAPSASNLTNSTLGSELAINITDGKLFYKDNANAVQVIGWKTVPATAGGTGQTSYAVGDILYASSTTALSKLADVATGNALISGGVGVAPSWGKIGLTTHVSGQLPLANGGTNANLTAVNGGVAYSSASAIALTAAGTTGQVLKSNGAAAPTWVTQLASANLPVGSILQVVQASYSTATSSSDTANYTDTGLSASITPTSSSSKILILVTIPTLASATYYNGAMFSLVRTSTSVSTLTNTDRVPVSGLAYSTVVTTMQYLDSPATTSSTTYKVQFKVISGGSGTMTVQHDSNASYITLLEVAA